MRIHTKLDYSDMYQALKDSGAPIQFEGISEHASRTHEHAFDVCLSGSGTYSNSGTHGAGHYTGATWDEWGAFFGALYDLDSDARCGGSVKRPVYANADDYHYKTGYRFTGWNDDPPGHLTYLPFDTHKRHNWQYIIGSGFACSKCSATRPPNF